MLCRWEESDLDPDPRRRLDEARIPRSGGQGLGDDSVILVTNEGWTSWAVDACWQSLRLVDRLLRGFLFVESAVVGIMRGEWRSGGRGVCSMFLEYRWRLYLN